jgi:hypothetical protein
LDVQKAFLSCSTLLLLAQRFFPPYLTGPTDIGTGSGRRLQIFITLETTIQPMLSNEEEEALKSSAGILKEAAAELNF